MSDRVLFPIEDEPTVRAEATLSDPLSQFFSEEPAVAAVSEERRDPGWSSPAVPPATSRQWRRPIEIVGAFVIGAIVGASPRLVTAPAAPAVVAPVPMIGIGKTIEEGETPDQALSTTPAPLPPPTDLSGGDAAAPPSRAAEPRPAPTQESRAQAPRPPRLSTVEPVQFRGALAVESDPAGAQVFLDGEAIGTTPLLLDDVRVGSRSVRVEMEGYSPWSAAVRVVADERAEVAVRLRAAAAR